MQIRRARAQDWAESKRIRLQALREAPMAFASTYDREIEFDDEMWRSRIESAAQFLAFDDDVVIGTATGFVDAGTPDTVNLVAMFVDPEARGRGIARGLVDAVVEQARAVGARRVALHVVDSNDVARRLYERCRFTPTGATLQLPHAPQTTELEYELVLESSTDSASHPGSVGSAG